MTGRETSVMTRTAELNGRYSFVSYFSALTFRGFRVIHAIPRFELVTIRTDVAIQNHLLAEPSQIL